MKTPLDLLCQRCYDQLQWRIDYRKYKPLKQPHKCNMCHKPLVLKAYRTICDMCSQKGPDGQKRKLCTKCCCDVKQFENADGQKGKYAVPRQESAKDEKAFEKEAQDIENALEGLKLRQRKTVERKL